MTMKVPFSSFRIEHGPQTIEATSLGKERAEQFAVQGEELTVLLALVQHGRQTPAEVARNAHVEEHKTKALLNAFIRRGWATTGSAGR